MFCDECDIPPNTMYIYLTYHASLKVLLPHLLLKQLCNCKCAYAKYLYVASVLMYFNIIHGFMEGGRFECFNMWDYKLNNMCQLVGTSMGVFFRSNADGRPCRIQL